MPTPCLYDTCESLTPWSWSSLLTPSIDTSIKKEGTASIKVLKAAYYDGPTQQFARDFAQCDSYFGIWLRHNLAQANQAWTIRVVKANGAFADISFAWNAFVGYVIWSDAVYALGGSAGYSNGYSAPNEWAFYEIYTDAVGNTAFHKNGVFTHTYAGYGIYPTAYLRVHCGVYGVPSQSLWLDYAKWGPGWDYPPVPPSLKLHPFWKLKPP